MYTVDPWNSPFNIGALRQRIAIVPDSLNNMCVTDIKVNIDMLLRNLLGTVQPYYRIMLTHNGISVQLSGINSNPLFNSSVQIPDCCAKMWCSNTPITWQAYNDAWESSDPVWVDNNFACSLNLSDRTQNIWSTDQSGYAWQQSTVCSFTCPNASSGILQNCISDKMSCANNANQGQDPCCFDLWCNSTLLNWASYKKEFGPRGGFWDTNDFFCHTEGTWPTTPQWGSNWKDNPAVGATCDFTCQVTPNLPWTQSCHSDPSTCTSATTGTPPPAQAGTCAKFPPEPQYGVPSTLCYDSGNVPNLQSFLSTVLSGPWELTIETVDSSTVIGALQDWELNFQIVNCYARKYSH